MKHKQIKVNAISYAHLVRAMIDGDKTCLELAEITGLHYVTVLQYTRELHKVGAAHISMWLPDKLGRESIKVYKIGRGFDAKRFRMSQAERQRRYRERQRFNREQRGFMGGMAA